MKPKFPFLAAFFTLALAPTAFALTGTWAVDANGLWSTSGNWSGGTIADGSGFTANFTNDITADRTVSLDADRILTNVIFSDSDTATVGSWTLDNNGTSTNNLVLAGTTPTITVNALGTGKSATISAEIQGTVGLTKAGTGTLILSGANTYSGGTSILNGGGTLRLESLGSLGAGNVTIATAGANTGTLELALTGTNVITNTFSGFSSANSLSTGGSAQIRNVSGTNTINSTLDIANTGGSGLNIESNGGLLTLAGTITTDENFRVLSLGGSGNGVVSGVITQLTGSDAMSINKTGAGTWIFTNNSNSYNRRLQIYDGTIQVGDGGLTGALSSGQDVIFDATATPGAKLVFNRSNSYSYGSASAEISGPGSVVHAGAGTTTLSGTNTYTGGTTITAGTLQLTGNQSAATGGFAVGTANAAAGTLNIGSGSQSAGTTVAVVSGKTMQFGSSGFAGTSGQSVNLTGNGVNLTTVNNAGTLVLGRASSATLGASSVWNQSGAFSMLTNGGYAASLTLNTGSTFDYSGGSDISLGFSGTSSASSSILIAGGNFITGRAFGFADSSSTGKSILTLANSGKITLSNNVASLDTGHASGVIQLGDGGGIIDTNGFSSAIDRGIANVTAQTGSLTKDGLGTLTLSGTNTYTGNTSVTAGKLVINGSISTSLLTTVDGAATLAGIGTVGAATINGSLAPGDGGIESLDFSGDLTLAGASVFEINASATTADLAISSALLTFGGTLNVTNIAGTLADGQMFDLFNWASKTGTFSSVTLPALTGGLAWDQSQLYTDGTITVVPEPRAAILGLIGMFALLRRRRIS